MKRIVGLLLAAVMLFSAAGCSTVLPEMTQTGGPLENGTTDLMDGITVRPVEGADIGENAPQIMDFYLALSRRSAGNGNMLVSPLSVLAALAMTANGAKGETLAQMEEVLGLDVQQLNSWMHSYMSNLPETDKSALRLANSIWFTDSESFSPGESFLQTNADYYGAGIYQTPFDHTTLKAINSWVEENTGGIIKDILDEIPEDAVMYLVNALAFEAVWQQPYEEHQIRNGVFTLLDGTESAVTLMHSEESLYLKDDHAAGFIKYYAGGDYAFAALLPHSITPAQYLNTITAAGLCEMLSHPEEITVYAAIPKFEMNYSVEMSEVLKAMGMVDAFRGEAADLSGIGTSTMGNLHISRVLHKTAITVAEQGTKAGAATAVEIRANGAWEEAESKTVILDQPFVYMLIDCKDNMPFFIGTMEDPLQTTNELAPPTDEPMPILQEPPQLLLHCGNSTAAVRPSSYQWDCSVAECDCSGVIACGPHPLQFETYPTLQPENSEVTLDFVTAAQNWSVICWRAEYYGQPKAPTTDVTSTENGFLLNEGDYIYVVSARWDTPQYSGTAEYVFRIEK